jgi:hypothetical protein
MEDLYNNKESGDNIIDTIGDAVKDFLGLENEPNKDVDKTGGTGKTYVSAEQLKENRPPLTPDRSGIRRYRMPTDGKSDS